MSAPRILDASEALAAGVIHREDCLGMPAEAVNWCVHT